jgi:hypothetical protein
MQIAQYLLDLTVALIFVAIVVAPRLVGMHFAVRSLKSSSRKAKKTIVRTSVNGKQSARAILRERTYLD